MAIHDLERARVEALARDLAAAFNRDGRGVLIVQRAHVEDVDRWRRAARRVGRLLGIHVRTGVGRTREHVWMARVDDDDSA